MSSSTHKALLLDKKFGDYVVESVETPTPGPGQLGIKIFAASLNPVDWKIRKYGFFVSTFPAILGSDLAGEVAHLGEGVTDFAIGDRVVVQGQYTNARAGFQQYALASADVVSKIPENVSYDEAATVPVALTAAHIGLYASAPRGFGLDGAKGKYTNIPFVVLGGPTSVGQVVIQLVKNAGFFPILTTASPKHAEYLKSIGATEVFDRNLSDEALVQAITEATSKAGSQPVTHVYDAVSEKETQETALKILSGGGLLAVVQGAKIEPPKDVTLVQVMGVYNEFTAAQLSGLYHDELFGLLKDGVIKPNQVEVLPEGLAGIPEGLKRLENGQISRVHMEDVKSLKEKGLFPSTKNPDEFDEAAARRHSFEAD